MNFDVLSSKPEEVRWPLAQISEVYRENIQKMREHMDTGGVDSMSCRLFCLQGKAQSVLLREPAEELGRF